MVVLIFTGETQMQCVTTCIIWVLNLVVHKEAQQRSYYVEKKYIEIAIQRCWPINMIIYFNTKVRS
jgi:hypothetical protein